MAQSLRTAVLFLVFNRPNTSAKVFEVIRQAKPPRLYVAADGPREGRVGEARLTKEVREIATAVDWPCELKMLFRDKNLGCKCAVSSAITWFFEQEQQGIILEDDCLPHPDFFTFCEILLNRYVNNEKVSVITGDNFQNGKQRGEGSYYFSRYNHVWGWASWRRAWRSYDGNLSFWPEWKFSQRWRDEFPCRVERRYWEQVFDLAYAQQIDTWDYPWTASVWHQGGLTATSNVNLVSNIGFGADSTHTRSEDSPFSSIGTNSLGELIHPAEVIQNLDADRYTFDNVFGGKLLRFPWSWLALPRRAVGFMYRSIKRAFA